MKYTPSCSKENAVNTDGQLIEDYENEQRVLAQQSSIVNEFPTISNPDNPVALCIGCGCERTYKKCKNGIQTGCLPLDVVISDEDLADCCRDQRRECHRCANGMPICIRITFMAASIDSLQNDYILNNGDIVPLNLLRADQLSEIAYLSPVIAKWQDGQTLDQTDYELLDEIE